MPRPTETEIVDAYMDAYRKWQDANEKVNDAVSNFQTALGFLKTVTVHGLD